MRQSRPVAGQELLTLKAVRGRCSLRTQAKPEATQAKPEATQAKPEATQAKPEATQAMTAAERREEERREDRSIPRPGRT
jgi:hypothetical protein